MNKESLTREQLMSLVSYDQDTGRFTWVSAKRYGLVGKVAGTKMQGYVMIRINRIGYLAHRLAWLYVYGKFPNSGIDHINGDTSDNRICNIREADILQNMQNKSRYKTNTTGYTGVYPAGDKYAAKIQSKGIGYYLGVYETAEEASYAYKKAKASMHTFNPGVRE